MRTNNEKEIKDYLARIFDCINNKSTLGIDYKHIYIFGNSILYLDNKCADLYFLKNISLLFNDDRCHFWHKVFKCDDSVKTLHIIFFSSDYNYYLHTQDEYKNIIKSFFIQSIMDYFSYNFTYFLSINNFLTESHYSRVMINSISICFYYTDRIFAELEENLPFLRKYVSSSEIEEVIDYFQHTINEAILPHSSLADIYWTHREQYQFEKAFYNRFLQFTKNAGYEKDIKISFNYANVQKQSGWYNISLFLIFPPIGLYLLVEIVYAYCTLGRKGKILLKKYSNELLIHDIFEREAIKSPCISVKNPYSIGFLEKINPILANDLKNIELVKNKLSSYYSNQELFDSFMRVNYEMYIIPCITYMDGKEKVSFDELERFHRIFTKVKAILEKKVDEFEHQRNLISNVEFDVIEQDIDNKLKFN